MTVSAVPPVSALMPQHCVSVDGLVDGVHEIFRRFPRELSEQEVRVDDIDDVFIGFVERAAFFNDGRMRFSGVFAVAFLQERRADVVFRLDVAQPLRKSERL